MPWKTGKRPRVSWLPFHDIGLITVPLASVLGHASGPCDARKCSKWRSVALIRELARKPEKPVAPAARLNLFLNMPRCAVRVDEPLDLSNVKGMRKFSKAFAPYGLK